MEAPPNEQDDGAAHDWPEDQAEADEEFGLMLANLMGAANTAAVDSADAEASCEAVDQQPAAEECEELEDMLASAMSVETSATAAGDGAEVGSEAPVEQQQSDKCEDEHAAPWLSALPVGDEACDAEDQHMDGRDMPEEDVEEEEEEEEHGCLENADDVAQADSEEEATSLAARVEELVARCSSHTSVENADDVAQAESEEDAKTLAARVEELLAQSAAAAVEGSSLPQAAHNWPKAATHAPAEVVPARSTHGRASGASAPREEATPAFPMQTPFRSRLSKNSAAFGAASRAAAAAAAASPVLVDPYTAAAPSTASVASPASTYPSPRGPRRSRRPQSDAGRRTGLIDELAPRPPSRPPSRRKERSRGSGRSEGASRGIVQDASARKSSDKGRKICEVPPGDFGLPGDGLNFTVKLDRSNGDPLGLNVGHARENTALIVLDVKDGLVEKWNKHNHKYMVQKEDHIVAVNGRRTASKDLVAMLKNTEPLELLIDREPKGVKVESQAASAQRSASAGLEVEAPGGGRRPAPPQLPPERSPAPHVVMPPPHLAAPAWGGPPGHWTMPPHMHAPLGNAHHPHAPTPAQPSTMVAWSRTPEAVCAICFHSVGEVGTLNLRKCGHKVHAACVAGAKHDLAGHVVCGICEDKGAGTSTYSRSRSHEGMPKWQDVASKLAKQRQHKSGTRKRRRSHSRSRRRRRRARSSKSTSKRRRKHHSKTRRRRRKSRSSSSSSSSSNSTTSSGDDSSSVDRTRSISSKPACANDGGVSERKGASRFCAGCDRHLGWVELPAHHGNGPAPEVRCADCTRKQISKGAGSAQKQIAQKLNAQKQSSTPEKIVVIDEVNGHAAAPEAATRESDELDQGSFFLALDQVREAESSDEAEAALCYLIRSRPSLDLLENVDYVTEFAAQCAGDGRVAELANRLCTLWKERHKAERPCESESERVVASDGYGNADDEQEEEEQEDEEEEEEAANDCSAMDLDSSVGGKRTEIASEPANLASRLAAYGAAPPALGGGPLPSSSESSMTVARGTSDASQLSLGSVEPQGSRCTAETPRAARVAGAAGGIVDGSQVAPVADAAGCVGAQTSHKAARGPRNSIVVPGSSRNADAYVGSSPSGKEAFLGELLARARRRAARASAVAAASSEGATPALENSGAAGVLNRGMSTAVVNSRDPSRPGAAVEASEDARSERGADNGNSGILEPPRGARDAGK